MVLFGWLVPQPSMQCSISSCSPTFSRRARLRGPVPAPRLAPGRRRRRSHRSCSAGPPPPVSQHTGINGAVSSGRLVAPRGGARQAFLPLGALFAFTAALMTIGRDQVAFSAPRAAPSPTARLPHPTPLLIWKARIGLLALMACHRRRAARRPEHPDDAVPQDVDATVLRLRRRCHGGSAASREPRHDPFRQRVRVASLDVRLLGAGLAQSRRGDLDRPRHQLSFRRTVPAPAPWHGIAGGASHASSGSSGSSAALRFSTRSAATRRASRSCSITCPG